MAMAMDRHGFTGAYLERRRAITIRPLVQDPGVRGLVARRDDRLLRDVGLTREDVLGSQGYFWSEWRRIRVPWSL